jgi:hypothetical protein
MKRPFSYRVVYYLKYGRFPQPLTLNTLLRIELASRLYSGRAGGMC